MSSLPSHWSEAELSRLGVLHCGQSPSSAAVNLKGLGTPYVSGPEQWDGTTIHCSKWTTAPTRVVPDGCIFITVKGAGVGTLFPGIACAIGRDVYAFEPAEGVDRRFIALALTQSISAIVRAARGDIPGLSKADILDHVVGLPPLNEQRRVALKVDSLSAKSKRARDHLDHIPRLVEKYKQAILAAAFRGVLTADWRATNASKASSKWNKRPLADICDPRRPITYGVIKLGSEIPNGVPCLRTSNVRWLRVDTEGMKRISPKLSSEYARTILRGGEVLVNVRGTLGGVAVATPSMTGWNVSREVAVAPVDTTIVDPDYVAYWIGADASQRWLNQVEKGVAYTGINIEDLRKIPVEFSSMDEQREIIRRIRTAFAWIDHLASETTNARKLIDHLDQAVLAKAFRGELVPQDPNDEPASVLVEHIRAGRGNGSVKPIKRNRSRN